MTIDPSHICQIEIPVSNPKASLAFYEQAFGWRRVPIELHNYFVLDVPVSCCFGLSLVVSKAPSGARAGAVVYFAVSNLEQRLAAVAKAGGQLLWGPKKVPGTGFVAQVADLDGNRWGLRDQP